MLQPASAAAATPSRPERFARRWLERALLIDVAVLLLAPLLLLAIDLEWILTPFGQIDSWVYFGTFVNLPYNIVNFAGTYYTSRLSWVLPGFLVHAVLPPVAASVVLHLAVLYASVFGVYGCLRMTVGRRTALVIGLVLVAYQPFLSAVGWDYVDGAGIAYFLLALACGTAAARRRRPDGWGFGSGVFLGAGIVTNVAWLMLMPAYVHYLLALSPRLSVGQYVQRASAIAAGAAAVTLVCGYVNEAWTGNFWFFIPSVTMARALVAAKNPWQLQTYTWLADSALLGTTAALFILSLNRVRQVMRHGGADYSIAMHMVSIWSTTVMLAVQLSGTPVLQFSYYASYLLPGMALAVGELSARHLERLPGRAFAGALAAGATAWALCFAGSSGAALFAGTPRFAVVAVLVGGAALLLASSPTRPLARGVAGLCIFAVLLAHQAPPSGAPGERRRNIQLTVDSLAQLHPIQAERRLLFWYADDAPRALSEAYRSIASCYLWGFRLFSAKFPERTMPDGGINTAQSGQRIVLLTAQSPAVKDVESRLGAEIAVVKEIRIARDGVGFNMLVFDVR